MSVNLLEREKEFQKLNDELQNRNKKFMQDFDNVMKKQDYVLQYDLLHNVTNDYNALNTKSDQNTLKVVNKYSTKNKSNIEITGKENPDILQNVIPETVDQMGVQGMGVFYRAKIKSLVNEKDKLHLELKNKCDELKNLQKENHKLIEQKDKWLQAFNTNKTNCVKLENQITLLNTKCQTRESENASLRKENEQFKKDLKSNTTNISGAELKLGRALGENEKIRSALHIAKQEEKALKELHKKEILEMTNIVKRLEKQKSDILTAFKKQMYLIDNLKKQKACLEGLKLAQVSENEFMKILGINN